MSFIVNVASATLIDGK